MPRTSGFTSHGPNKQWVEILTCDPATQVIQGILGDGGKVSITLGDIPAAFRWPKVGEWWAIERDAINPTLWNLGNRVHGRTSEIQDGNLAYSLNEKAPIEDMEPGEARIDADAVYDALGRRFLLEGDSGGGSVGSGGGGNYIPNPSFEAGLTGYSAVGGGLTLNTISGLFGPKAGTVTKSGGVGTLTIISPRGAVKPHQIYNASVSLRRGTNTSVAAKDVTAKINWYDAIGTLKGTQAAAPVTDSVQNYWDRVGVSSALSPDTAAQAEIRIDITNVNNGDSYYFDGFQLDLASSFNSSYADSTLTGNALIPGAISDRELSTDLFDALVTEVLAGIPPQVNGVYDFPFSVDPRSCDGNRTLTANNLYFYRVNGYGSTSKLAFSVGVADAAATAYGGVYTNIGSGRSARPSARRASGSVSLSGTGYKEIPLGTTLTVNHGEWFAFGSTSATATYLSSAPNPGGTPGPATITDALAHFQAATLPTMPNPVGTLSNFFVTVTLVGVA